MKQREPGLQGLNKAAAAASSVGCFHRTLSFFPSPCGEAEVGSQEVWLKMTKEGVEKQVLHCSIFQTPLFIVIKWKANCHPYAVDQRDLIAP